MPSAARSSAVDDLGAVDGLDDVGVRRRPSAALLDCSWPMKWTRDGRRGGQQLGHLGRGLLVAVLADVPDAEVGEQVEVGRREELRHDDELISPGRARRPRARGAIRAWTPARLAGELVAAAAVAHGGAPRRRRPAKRPVAPSRR